MFTNKIEKYLEKYFPVFFILTMFYFIVLVVLENIRWVIITLK